MHLQTEHYTRSCSAVGKVSGTNASLTADPGMASSILARSHTFMKIDHEIIYMVILLPSAESFKKGCFSVTSESMYTKYWLTACSGKSVVR